MQGRANRINNRGMELENFSGRVTIAQGKFSARGLPKPTSARGWYRGNPCKWKSKGIE